MVTPLFSFRRHRPTNGDLYRRTRQPCQGGPKPARQLGRHARPASQRASGCRRRAAPLTATTSPHDRLRWRLIAREELVGEVAVGQCSGELQGADHHSEDRERVRSSRLDVCRVRRDAMSLMTPISSSVNTCRSGAGTGLISSSSATDGQPSAHWSRCCGDRYERMNASSPARSEGWVSNRAGTVSQVDPVQHARDGRGLGGGSHCQYFRADSLSDSQYPDSHAPTRVRIAPRLRNSHGSSPRACAHRLTESGTCVAHGAATSRLLLSGLVAPKEKCRSDAASSATRPVLRGTSSPSR
jgi:hypothetical protein